MLNIILLGIIAIGICGINIEFIKFNKRESAIDKREQQRIFENNLAMRKKGSTRRPLNFK